MQSAGDLQLSVKPLFEHTLHAAPCVLTQQLAAQLPQFVVASTSHGTAASLAPPSITPASGCDASDVVASLPPPSPLTNTSFEHEAKKRIESVHRIVKT